MVHSALAFKEVAVYKYDYHVGFQERGSLLDWSPEVFLVSKMVSEIAPL